MHDLIGRTGGQNVDLILEKGNRRIAVEYEASSVPVVTKEFYNSLVDLRIDEAWIVELVKERFTIKGKV